MHINMWTKIFTWYTNSFGLYQSKNKTTNASVVIKNRIQTRNPAFLRIASRNCSLPSRIDSFDVIVERFKLFKSHSCLITFSENNSCNLDISANFFVIINKSERSSKKNTTNYVLGLLLHFNEYLFISFRNKRINRKT
ncbi:hypothetical protein DERP_009912 [Dermatophagoides pteronyssinus]|uniref:Uncharacterized protein n=1 Tax=Dermatophagoides pteronyssinus TaxID=6956 RepID=A0ABQ8J1X1_DERPT|nr:hypothetical protein DERP_009912 [Dermatophagoides pteronyssinus]